MCQDTMLSLFIQCCHYVVTMLAISTHFLKSLGPPLHTMKMEQGLSKGQHRVGLVEPKDDCR